MVITEHCFITILSNSTKLILLFLYLLRVICSNILSTEYRTKLINRGVRMCTGKSHDAYLDPASQPNFLKSAPA